MNERLTVVQARQLKELVNNWMVLNQEDFLKIAYIFDRAAERELKLLESEEN